MALKSVVSPALKQGLLPEWLTDRGGDCRGFDRRSERHVYGPSHLFQEPTDIVLNNGLIRFWVGNKGLPPFLNVQAFTDGTWRNVGTLLLDGDSTEDVLVDATISRCTPDQGTVRLSCRNAGDILCTLKRGHRGVFVQHGGTGFPDVVSGRYVRWSGLPPYALAQDVHSSSGAFGRGLKTSVGQMWDDPDAPWDDPLEDWDAEGTGLSYIKFFWPIPTDAWALPFRWLPRLSDADQPNSGLFSLYDSDDEEVGKLEYLAASKTFRFTLGANTVSSPAHTFDAHDALYVAPRFDTVSGMALTTKPAAISHVTNPAVDVADSFIYLRWGLISGDDAGDGDAGDGTAGGSPVFAEGDFDDAKLFIDRLTNDESAAMADSSEPLEDLPTPESRLVWYAPFDTVPVPTASDLANGRRYETSASGERRSYNGLTRAIAGLTGDVADRGFGLGKSGTSHTTYAYLATEEANDDLADHHEQFAASSEQTTRIR